MQPGTQLDPDPLCACTTDDWTCGVCFRPGSEHDTCPDCQHCPGYPHDYGCER